LLRVGPGVRPIGPAQVGRRGPALQAPAHEAERIVVALQREIARHHRLLEDLPLGVAAPDAVNLGFDGLEMAQGPRVVAGRKGGYPLHEVVRLAARDRVPLLPESPQAVGETRLRRPVAAYHS